MTRRIPDETLRALRNDIPIRPLIAEELELPWKLSEGIFRFLCPICSDFHTATNPRTNLARCFRCRRNFNPIEIVMAAEGCTFLDAVRRLRRKLGR
jgi:DNA primase